MQDGWSVCTNEDDVNHEDIMNSCPATCAMARNEPCPRSTEPDPISTGEPGNCTDVNAGSSLTILDWTANDECTDEIWISVGESVEIHFTWYNTVMGCPLCVEQLYVGIVGIPYECVFSTLALYEDETGLHTFD